MSSFCWCIINIDKNTKESFFSGYKKNNVICIFDKDRHRFLDQPLAIDEIFCNIACGYDNVPHLSPEGILNNDNQFFGYAFPPKTKIRDMDILDFAKRELKKRLDFFQSVIWDLYSLENVCCLTLYFTETANELSLFEYQHMDWKIDEISVKISELAENNYGLIPAFKLKLKKR